jgi:hypothetical protein
MIEHLAGMQSQAPRAPYIGLWTRLRDFAPDSLSTLTEQREVVRIHLMRTTVHLVSARDALDWRPMFDPPLDKVFRGDFDREALARRAVTLMEERPRTRAELGRLLAEDWPGADPASLAYAATNSLALCQVPPRGVWGRTGPAAWAQVETWLGAPLRSVPMDGLVLRYLGAFGPASVPDIQMWSGLTRLREVTDRLRPRLRSFRNEAGKELFDLPDAPRPDPDTPAPVRFLPQYDNLALSHADRSHLSAGAAAHWPTDDLHWSALLVDGFVAGVWRLVRDRKAATLVVRLFGTLADHDQAGVAEEGERLLAFLAPDAEPREVRLGAAA